MRVPLLTAQHKTLRIAWTGQHRHWTADDWKHVVWSDESRFQLIPDAGRVRVRRQPHELKDPTCQKCSRCLRLCDGMRRVQLA
ncbi:transposable element Tcb2 transposase [Trichonephila clavipes]|nr:transposable element Tcb2 transposase [Trichonephila clavipes]